MHLKRIELVGFKSFADRTELEFVPGVTAVVGPNGSGKSNVSDGIRWVLGEQSAKSLRGSKMEDVIFAGSDTRKPVNFCEVSLTMDNVDHALDIDYSEVTITRRVYRTGDSEYFINKQSCRLRDITELFMDTGVGKEAYSIIGQGRIEEILSTKSEDRRGIFEEAAGIVKYKTRKKAAMKKLEDTEQNLLRVGDIIHEVEEQLGPLSEQAEKAQKYKELKAELQTHEVGLYVSQIALIHKEWESGSRLVNELLKDQVEVSSKLNQRDAQVEELRLKNDFMQKEIDEFQTRLVEVIAEAEKNEGRREVLRERKKNDQKNIIDSKQQLESLEQKKERMQAQYNEQRTLMDEKKAQKRQVEQELELEQKVSGASMDLDQEIEKNNEVYITLSNKIAALESEGEHYSRAKHLSEQKERELLEHRTGLDEQQIEIESKKAAVNQQLQACSSELEYTIETYQKNVTKYRDRTAKLDEQKSSLRKVEQSLDSLISKRELLKDMQTDFSGFFQGVKEILRQREKGFDGIHGAVAELIKVPKNYETAIEIALGSALQNVVVSDEETARRAIQFLKKNHLGRATFLPISVIRSRLITHADRTLAQKQEEIIGIASELIQFDPKHRNVMENLLGAVLIAHNLEAANRAARIFGQRYRIVTLEGDVVNPGGSMTGGSVKQNKSNLLGRNREIEQIEKEIVELSKRVESLQRFVESEVTELQALSQQLEEIRAQGEALRLKEQEYKGSLNEISMEMGNLKERIQQIEKEQMYYRSEIKNSEDQTSQLQHRIARYKDELLALKGLVNELEKRKKDSQDSAQIKNDRITELKVAIAKIQQEYENACVNVERIEEELGQTKQEINQLMQYIDELESGMNQGGDQESEIEKKGKELKLAKDEISSRIDRLRSDRQSMIQSIEKEEKESRDLRNELRGIEQRLHEKEVKVNRFEVELDNLLAKLREEYELSFELASEKYPIPDDTDRVKAIVSSLKREIAALGAVNLGAIEEYQRLFERQEFLSGQKEDLTEAKDKLFKVIKEMEREMSQRFYETFEKIRVKFSEVFAQLFGGGRADLVLTDPDDVLDTGIEIVAQPPGKKLQYLALLSGGERALTAICLLFAILKVKPVPFCVLDEVEAALDEANVYRFVEYLKEFSAQTQFIVVTHRKGTMEGADVLYGITMQESGVSNLVSVRLDDRDSMATA